MALPLRLSPDQVSLILKRAGELDAKGSSLTSQEVLEIAAEAGLDPFAAETAMRDILAGEASPTALPTAAGPSVQSTVLHASVGVILGVVAAAISSPINTLPALGGVVLFALFRLLHGRFRETKLTLFFENLVTWLAFGIGAGIANNSDYSVQLMVLALPIWLLTSIIAVALPRGMPAGEISPPH